MKALVLKEDKTLIIRDEPKPTAGPNECVVALKASALNHREIWLGKGLYPGMRLPCILGADGAGVVTEIGSEVSADWKGKEVIIYPAYDWGNDEQAPTRQFRVLGMPDPGTIAEYIKVPVSNILEKPKYLNWEEAAAAPLASLTSWRAMVKMGGLKKGHKVLITGIGGGVAQAGLGIALAMGADVFVSSSSPDKIAVAVESGAIAGVNYKDVDWHLQLKELSGGIDIVLDSSPVDTLDRYFKFMNYGGRIVTYGSTGSPKTTISISKFFLRHIQFIGSTMGSPKDFKDVIAFMEEHSIRPKIHKVFPFTQAIDALDALATGKQTGKIVIGHVD